MPKIIIDILAWTPFIILGIVVLVLLIGSFIVLPVESFLFIIGVCFILWIVWAVDHIVFSNWRY